MDRCRNGGRAEAEREFAKSLHYYGADEFILDGVDASSYDGDPNISDDASEGHVKNEQSLVTEELLRPRNQLINGEKGIPNSELGTTRETARKWLESL